MLVHTMNTARAAQGDKKARDGKSLVSEKAVLVEVGKALSDGLELLVEGGHGVLLLSNRRLEVRNRALQHRAVSKLWQNMRFR